MPRLVARLLLSVMTLPVGAIGYLLAFNIAQIASNSKTAASLWGGVIGWLVVIVYFSALWGGTVNWTGDRIVKTAIATVFSLVGGMAVLLAMTPAGHDWALTAGTLCVPAFWVVGVVIAWRDSPDEHRTRTHASSWGLILCPKCGYDLTGLTHSKCPECGTPYTLEELLAAQTGRELI